jgi:hypothetical protein
VPGPDLALFAERIGSAALDLKPLLGDLGDLERFLRVSRLPCVATGGHL